MSCDKCKKQINNTIGDCTCSCGLVLCHGCQTYHIYLAMDEESHSYESACINDILKHGERGYIEYYKNDATFTVKDPDYEPMKQELKQLHKEVEELKEKNEQCTNKIEELQTEIDCMPGGKEHLAAKKRFESQQ